jgi:transcriptional regulator with XRE-family HTH domain
MTSARYSEDKKIAALFAAAETPTDEEGMGRRFSAWLDANTESAEPTAIEAMKTGTADKQAILQGARARGAATAALPTGGSTSSGQGMTRMVKQSATGFARLLRLVRKRALKTQQELAQAATLSPRTVSDLERGINKTTHRDTARLLATALGLAGEERDRFVAAACGKLAPATVESWSDALAGTFRTTPGAASAEADEGYDDADASNIGWIKSALSSRFVGRERELGALREAWSRARTGHRLLALIAGEPGIGKTALTAELAQLVHADGGLVLYGRWDEEVLASYQAFREALGDYARACPEALLRRDLGDIAGEIACLFPEAAQRTRVLVTPPPAEAGRFRLFESIDTWIQRTAARRPVLLILDDLQWADRSSFLLLSYLMQARRSTPLMAVAMYRDSGLERSVLPASLPSLTRDIDCRRLLLRGLHRAAITELLRAEVGLQSGERESVLARDLERETGGNPFFLREMARHLSDLGVLDQEGSGLDEMSADIPESVRGMLRSWLSRLSNGCAQILAVASVIGERFDTALVASAASLEITPAVALLEEAARAGLITEINDTPDYWRFTHSLTRRVFGHEFSTARTARLHQRIGEILESRPDVQSAELAHHFGAAASIGTAEKAVMYGRVAGKRALKGVAADVAVRHFTRALELLDRFSPQDQALRCELLLDLADAYDHAGESAARDERFAEAANAARHLGDDALFLQAALRYGGILPATVHPDARARALLEEALQRLSEEDSGERAMILARLAHWLHAERPYPQRRELSDRSVAMARGTADPRILATVLIHRCWALDGPGDVDDALAAASEILSISAESGDYELELEGLRIQLAAQFEKGDHYAAMHTATDMRKLAEEVGDPEFIRLAAMWDIALATMEGRFEDAEELTGKLGHQLRRTGHSQAQIVPVAQTFSWRVLQGHAGDYITGLKAVSATQPSNLAWTAITAWCLAETGDRDAAAALLRQTGPAAAASADRNYLWWAMIVGFSGAADLLGDKQWAAALYDLAVPYAGNNCTLGVASLLGAADHWLGVLAGLAGRHAQAIAHLEAALARHGDMDSRPLTALTQEAYAHVLYQRADPADAERARQLTASATRTADELGLTAIKDRHLLRG